MKKTFFSALLITLSSFSTSLFAAPTPPVIFKTKILKEKTIQLQLANLEKKYTYVSITNMDGDLIYFSEGVKERNGYRKAINISNLTDGRYIIKVKNGKEKFIQIFKISGDLILFSDFKQS